MFHIRNANPDDMRALLDVIDEYGEVQSTAEIVRLADEMGIAIQDRAHLDALPTARDLGLVELESIRLTPQGKMLLQIDRENPSLFPDIVHLLQYALWDSRHQARNCFSFSYRTLCQELWRGGSSPLLSRQQLAAVVGAAVNQVFGHDNAAFSSKSVGGALSWLNALDPRVISDNEDSFHRRTFCPPESLLLAIDLAYRENNLDYGTNLLLSESNRELIAEACLLEVSSLDRVLDYAVAQFDSLDKSLGGGWGHFIVLRCAPRMDDFVQASLS